MLGKSLLVLLWFPLTLVLLLVNLSLLATTRSMDEALPLSATPVAEGSFPVAALAGSSQVLGANIIAGDARSLLLASFLRGYNSPLAPYADLIVQEADKNGIDFRLVIAIAMCESNLGKRMPTQDSHNAWGIAVYTGKMSGAKFANWPEAIRWVSDYIREKYYDRGLVDLKDIGAVWAPPSVENGYSWTNCVESYQRSIL
ncbi:MAG: glucosaminidase domain-containing protein [Patescibacteria group bacterium]